MKDEGARVVQAHRFEVLDERDQVRAVLGIRTHENTELVGLEIFDQHGSARVWILDDSGEGAQFAFATAGNQVLVISAYDDGGEVDAGPSVTLCDRDGMAVLGWAVSPSGEVSTVHDG